MFTLLGLTIPLMLIINFTVSNASRELLVSLVGENGTDMLRLYLVMAFFEFNRKIHPIHLFFSCSYLVPSASVLGSNS